MGKSTLIRCLVKHYTKQNVGDISGPITVVAGGSCGLMQAWFCFRGMRGCEEGLHEQAVVAQHHSGRVQRQVSRRAGNYGSRLHRSSATLKPRLMDPPAWCNKVMHAKYARCPCTMATCAGKKRRLTFIECPPDLHGMLDAAKYADLVLLLVRARLHNILVLSHPSQPASTATAFQLAYYSQVLQQEGSLGCAGCALGGICCMQGRMLGVAAVVQPADNGTCFC